MAGLRLYRVLECFPGHPQWDRNYVVAAGSPGDAARLIEELNAGKGFREQPIVKGFPLRVYMPAGWWDTLPVGEAAEKVAALLPDPVMPSSCAHRDRLFLCGGSGCGDGACGSYSVRVCCGCGEFQVFKQENGMSMSVEFTICTEEILAAAGQWVRLLRHAAVEADAQSEVDM
jgi:hypothetical protein